MISCKQIATLAQSAREAIAAGEKWMRIEEDCLAILELANLATIGLFTKQQAEHAGIKPHVKWEDQRVQQVYEVLCRNDAPPPGDHWEGFQARLIVDALFGKQQAEPVGGEAGKIHAAWIDAGQPHSVVAFQKGYHAAQSGQLAGVADGWQLVPIEPTTAMLDAAEHLDWTNDDVRSNCCNQWNAMIAAAPTQQQERSDA